MNCSCTKNVTEPGISKALRRICTRINIQWEFYLLNREYKHFTGVIASSEKWGKSQYTVVLTIYGDGVPLFSTEIGKDSKPIAIDLDVTGFF